MDFEETRLYYSHQHLHQHTLEQNDENGTNVILDENQQQIQQQQLINDDNDDNQVPIHAVRRHFREFLSK
jgi:hypothetical protein